MRRLFCTVVYWLLEPLFDMIEQRRAVSIECKPSIRVASGFLTAREVRLFEAGLNGLRRKATRRQSV
jgi:hypothetical protein